MTWQHKFNEALGEYTGVRFSRVGKGLDARSLLHVRT